VEYRAWWRITLTDAKWTDFARATRREQDDSLRKYSF
jgi:hypothetical protein